MKFNPLVGKKVKVKLQHGLIKPRTWILIGDIIQVITKDINSRYLKLLILTQSNKIWKVKVKREDIEVIS